MAADGWGTLVSTQWLAANMAAADLRVLDCTYFMPTAKRDKAAEYAAAHIAGAPFFDVDEIADKATDLPHMLPTPAVFAHKVGALGVGSGDRVVVYDRWNLMGSSRAWWMFRVFGHDAVAVLDGGLAKWQAEGRPVTDAPARPTPRTFAARLRPELVRNADQMASNIERRLAQTVDARSAGRFSGTEPEIWPGRRSGHIPGSLNLPFLDVVDQATGLLKPTPQVADSFARAGLDLKKPVIASCGSGMSAAVLALAAHNLAGAEFAIYDGSWAEWGLPGDRPVATGAARPGG